MIITDRGKPSHVLMTYQDYTPPERLRAGASAKALAMPGLSDNDFTRRDRHDHGARALELD